jgi:hypothetical protein
MRAAMLWGPRAEAREVEAAKAAAPFLQPVAQMLTMGATGEGPSPPRASP